MKSADTSGRGPVTVLSFPIILLIAVALTAGVFLVACSIGLEPMSVNDETTDTEPLTPSTGVMVQVPTISSRLIQELNATWQPAPTGTLSTQALLFATGLEIDLRQGADPTPIETWSADATTSLAGGSQSENSSAPSCIETFLEIDAGTDYSMDVRVFNTNWSGTGAVVSGSSTAPFTIFPGQSTVVPILVLPTAPIEPTLGAPDSISIVPTLYTFSLDPENDGGIILTTTGGEEWFEIDLTGQSLTSDDYLRVIAEPAVSADAIMLIYDSLGVYLLDSAPAWSWGFLPATEGGEGGTRAGLMGPACDPNTLSVFSGYMGMILGERGASATAQEVTVMMEILSRPYESYTNAVPQGIQPTGDNFLALGPGQENTQVLFNTNERTVHWFELAGIDWGAIGLLNPLPITITATFDVLDTEQIQGGTTEWVWDDTTGNDVELFIPALSLFVGDDSTANDPEFFAPADDPDLLVTENPDGSTTVEFTIDVDTSLATSMYYAGIGVSSRWMGVRYTLSWSAPGSGTVIIE